MKILFPGKLPIPTEYVPLCDADMVSGQIPYHCGHTHTVIGDLSSGSWSSSAAVFNWTYYVDEIVYILKGDAMILEYGTVMPVHVEAGDVVHFQAGTRALWNVEEYIEKFWVIRTPKRSFISRIARRLRGFTSEGSGEQHG